MSLKLAVLLLSGKVLARLLRTAIDLKLIAWFILNPYFFSFFPYLQGYINNDKFMLAILLSTLLSLFNFPIYTFNSSQFFNRFCFVVAARLDRRISYSTCQGSKGTNGAPLAKRRWLTEKKEIDWGRNIMKCEKRVGRWRPQLSM